MIFGYATTRRPILMPLRSQRPPTWPAGLRSEQAKRRLLSPDAPTQLTIEYEARARPLPAVVVSTHTAPT